MRSVSRFLKTGILLAALSLSLIPAVAQDAPDPMTLIRQTVENDKANDKKALEYMYTEREATRTPQGSGFKTETRTREVFYLYGEAVHRLVDKDDKPLPAKEAAKEEQRISKWIEKRKNESESDRRKREEKAERDRQEEHKFLDEVADAFIFYMEPTQPVNGRDAWVIRAEPRPDYRPKSKEARFLPKVRFRVWIDKDEMQWARIEGDVIGDISFGWFLAKLQKGAHFSIVQARVNDEVWLPQHVTVNADARLLFKHFDFDSDITYRDYRKFRTDTKITGIVDSPPPPPTQQR